MKVLLTGTEGSGIDRVERLLRGSGHDVLSCDADAPPGASCVGCPESAACPASAGVDVIVAARQHPLPHLTSGERLSECALLTSVPLVVAGSTVLNPYGSRAVVLVEGFDGVVEACERAVATSEDLSVSA